MRYLLDYEILTNEVFYRCWHILDYIEQHPNLPELEKEAIKATIMDALVTKGLIDPTTQSLDFEKLAIVDDTEHYTYEKHPKICGIPLSIKEKLRTKAVKISGGIPVSMYISRAPRKQFRYCVYDPNTAVSSAFEDAIFYNAIYTSPTRGIRIERPRPFVEVDLDGELYLVDTLTKRILKSSWFKEEYGFEIHHQETISEMSGGRLAYHQEETEDALTLAEYLEFNLELMCKDDPSNAEMLYEIEQTKKNYPEEWKRYEALKQERAAFMAVDFKTFKKLRNEE